MLPRLAIDALGSCTGRRGVALSIGLSSTDRTDSGELGVVGLVLSAGIGGELGGSDELDVPVVALRVNDGRNRCERKAAWDATGSTSDGIAPLPGRAARGGGWGSNVPTSGLDTDLGSGGRDGVAGLGDCPLNADTKRERKVPVVPGVPGEVPGAAVTRRDEHSAYRSAWEVTSLLVRRVLPRDDDADGCDRSVRPGDLGRSRSVSIELSVERDERSDEPRLLVVPVLRLSCASTRSVACSCTSSGTASDVGLATRVGEGIATAGGRRVGDGGRRWLLRQRGGAGGVSGQQR